MTNFLRLGEYKFIEIDGTDYLGRDIVKRCEFFSLLEPNPNQDADFGLLLSDYNKMDKAKYDNDKYNFINAFNNMVEKYNDLFTQTKYNTINALNGICIYSEIDKKFNELSFTERIEMMYEDLGLSIPFTMLLPGSDIKFNKSHGILELVDDVTGLNLHSKIETLNLLCAVFKDEDRDILYQLIDKYAGGNYAERYKKELELFVDMQRRTELMLTMPKIRYSSYDAPTYVK